MRNSFNVKILWLKPKDSEFFNRKIALFVKNAGTVEIKY